MTVFEAIETRRSIRRYSDRPIEREKLERIAEAFRLSPSAGNGQRWKLIVVQKDDLRQKIRDCAIGAPAFVTEAPAVLVACGYSQNVMTCGHRVDTVDLSIALSFVVLEAWELGLGTCWMASYHEDALRKALNLGDDVSIVGITPLGYPAESPDARPRKSIDEVVEFR